MDDERAAPAGWYREDTHPGSLRWWDGTQWTDARRSADDSPVAAQAGAEHVAYRLPNAAGTPTVDATDEAERIEEIAAVVGRPLRIGEVSEQTLDVVLVPEPDHPSGTPAVSVRAGGRVIGYLPDAYRHARTGLDRVVAGRAAPTTTARLRAERSEDGLRASVKVALVAPELLVPLNAPPEERYSILPWGRALQVQREDEHFVRLTAVVPEGGRGLLLVTLHLVGGLVEVRLDGDRVGELTAATSEQFAPTLRHLAGLGLTAVAYCALQGSPLKAELTLQAARAAELPADWVDGPPVTLPRLVRGATEAPPAYVAPLRPTPRTSEAVARSTRRTVAWVIVGVCTLVGLSSWIIGDVLN
ncbi:DUF2510 domain-containing protein [Rathayibacter festucae]|uniref:DUF2510 domain-containing protein n=1 Tax=Rathayibacter festucae TaxID=110937 RepID=UPI002A699030|nr:DUF2510 domain-containing protein [Rathayibacter festucae]MDY0911309.1 DUF2510 domain-containing protein [Rathayibacter festucae]